MKLYTWLMTSLPFIVSLANWCMSCYTFTHHQPMLVLFVKNKKTIIWLHKRVIFSTLRWRQHCILLIWVFDEACIRLVLHLVLHRLLGVRLHTSLAEATGRLCELLAFLWIHITLSNGSLLHFIFHSREYDCTIHQLFPNVH